MSLLTVTEVTHDWTSVHDGHEVTVGQHVLVCLVLIATALVVISRRTLGCNVQYSQLEIIKFESICICKAKSYNIN